VSEARCVPFQSTRVEQEVELLGKELVVVIEVVAEEWIGLDEGASTDDDLGSALRDEVEGSEILEDANRIVGAEDGDCGGEADVLGASCGGGEENGW
jgi:hypothetical protein